MFIITNGLANRLLIPVLRSRIGRRLGRRLAVVEYVGRRSGEPHHLVTQYVSDARTVRIGVGMSERKTWWRNFQSARSVRLRLAGVDYDATAHVERSEGRVCVIAELEPGVPQPSAPGPRTFN